MDGRTYGRTDVFPPSNIIRSTFGSRPKKKKKVKEADLYSAFIEVSYTYTQGAQVQITQCYLQITPYLPLPRKHSPCRWRIPD